MEVTKVRLEDIKLPALKERELKILTQHHEGLKGRKNLTTVQKFEELFASCLVAKAAAKNERPWKTTLDAWGVIWCTLLLDNEWRRRDYDEMSVCFRVAATNVLRLIG